MLYNTKYCVIFTAVYILWSLCRGVEKNNLWLIFKVREPDTDC